jgi:DNA invertase Pin-like site-specific DNA recombinase
LDRFRARISFRHLVTKRSSIDRPNVRYWLLKDAQRRSFDVVMAWAIDRIGRSLIDLLGTIQTLEACGVDLYLDQQAIDTTTPAGKLVFQVTGAFAKFERSMIRQRVTAGLKRAVEQGKIASVSCYRAAWASTPRRARSALAPALCSASSRR